MRALRLTPLLMCLIGALGAVPAKADIDSATEKGQASFAAENHAEAEQASTWLPKPFKTRYRVRYEGVPFSATGTRELKQASSGQFHFESHISAFLIRMDEEAQFGFDEDGLRAASYAERRSGIAGNRDRTVDFDWSVPKVVRRGDKESELEIEGQVYDPVSWQIALQRDLSLSPYEQGDVFTYAVSNGGEPDVYRLEITEIGEISVPAGSFRTILLERDHTPDNDRETRIWLAPEHDHLLVRLEHIDDRKLTLTLEEIIE